MDARMLFGVLSTVFAFVGGALLFSHEIPSGKRDAVSFVSGEDFLRSGKIAWRLRNGFRCVLPVADVLLKNVRLRRFFSDVVALCAERQYRTSERTLMSVVMTVSAGLTVALAFVLGNVVTSVVVVVCCLVLLGVSVNAARDRRSDAIRESVPDILRSMGVCFEAGFTLLQTFRQIGQETRGPLKAPFMRAAHVLETGQGASEALAELRQGSAVGELAFVVVALDVQHQAGGSLRQVLDAARDTVEGELALKRSLRVQTAQAKLSARVVSVMPLVLVALFSVVSEGFLTPFFASPAGYALLALAVGMQLAGIALVRRVLSVEVGA